MRDGKKPQIRLTQAALVRLYLKDNQLEQASDELERLLKDEPTRVDLLLLMAQIAYQKKELMSLFPVYFFARKITFCP
jgi:Tfp pilus assembly protein PilF